MAEPTLITTGNWDMQRGYLQSGKSNNFKFKEEEEKEQCESDYEQQQERQNQRQDIPQSQDPFDYGSIRYIGRDKELDMVKSHLIAALHIPCRNQEEQEDDQSPQVNQKSPAETEEIIQRNSRNHQTGRQSRQARSRVNFIVVEGGSGTGKTRFIRETIQRLRVLHDQEPEDLKETSIAQTTNDGSSSHSTSDISSPPSSSSSLSISSTASSSPKPLLLIGSCTFDQHTSAVEPFRAIRQVLIQILDQLWSSTYSTMITRSNNMSSRQEYLHQHDRIWWSNQIQQSLGPDVGICCDLLPELRRWIQCNVSKEEESTVTSSSNEDSSTKTEMLTVTTISSTTTQKQPSTLERTQHDVPQKEWSFQRFKFAIRSLIRCISRQNRLVLVFDDIHLCDKDSYQIITALLKDDVLRPRHANAMNGVGDNSSSSFQKSLEGHHHSFFMLASSRPLDQARSEIRNLPVIAKHNDQIKVMGLSRWSLRDIQCALGIVMNRSEFDEDIKDNECYQHNIEEIDKRDLLNIIKSKTGGGEPYLVLQLLRRAEEEGILRSKCTVKRTNACFHQSMDKMATNETLKQNKSAHANGSSQQYQYLSAMPSSSSSSFHWSDFSKRIIDMRFSTSITDNIVERLRTVGENELTALEVAASMGVAEFDASSLSLAMSARTPFSRSDITMKGDNYEMQQRKRERVYDGEEEKNDDNDFITSENDSIVDQLQRAIQDGYLEPTASPCHYRFAHDCIREAAYSFLSSDDDRAKMHFRIGRHLRDALGIDLSLLSSSSFSTDNNYQECVQSSSDSILLFRAVSQLNLGIHQMRNASEFLDLSELNYRAAEISWENSSYSPAVNYLTSALACLRGASLPSGLSPWDTYPRLSLKYSIALVRMQYACCHYTDCIRTVDDVLLHTNDFDDQRCVLHVKLLCLLSTEQYKEGMTVALNALESIGTSVPRRCVLVHAVADLIKISRKLKGMTDEQILSLPETEGSDVQDTAELIERIGEYATRTGHASYVIFFSLRLILVMLQHGNFPLSSYSLMGWAFFKMQIEDYDQMIRFGKLSLQLATDPSKPHLVRHSARVQLGYWYFLHHWRNPMNECLVPLEKVFTDFWSNGLLDYWHMDYRLLLRLKFACGVPLHKLRRQCQQYNESMIDYKQKSPWSASAPMYQAIINLTSSCQDDDPTDLVGEIMPNGLLSKWQRDSTTNKAAIYQFNLWTSILSYHFGQFNKAATHVDRVVPGAEGPPDIFMVLHVFYTSLIYLRRYHETNDSRHRKKAAKAERRLIKWSTDGNPNTPPMLKLIEAERMAINYFRNASKKSFSILWRPNRFTSRFVSEGARSDHREKMVDQILRKYDESIQESSHLGLVHFKALGYELSCSFLVDTMKRRRSLQKGTFDQSALQRSAIVCRLNKAKEFYEQWGAVRIYNHLDTKLKINHNSGEDVA